MSRDYGFAGAVYNILKEAWKPLLKICIAFAILIISFCYALISHNSLLLCLVLFYGLGFVPTYMTFLMIHEQDEERLVENISEIQVRDQIKKSYITGKINSFEYTEKMARL